MMQDNDTEERPCPYDMGVTAEADCPFCQGNGCRFHRPEQQPCTCTVQDRHQSTRGHGYVTDSGYRVGTIADNVQAMYQQTQGETVCRLVGGPLDGMELQVVTKGGRPPVTSNVAYGDKGMPKDHNARYNRRGNRPGADGVWLYDHVADGTAARRHGYAAPIPAELLALTGVIPPVPEVEHDDGVVVRRDLPFGKVISDVPLPPPIRPQDVQPGEIPVQPSMGGAQPPPDDPAPAGHSWVRHERCRGLGCNECDQRGWTAVQRPPRYQ